MNVFRKYWIELSVVAVAVVVTTAGFVGNHPILEDTVPARSVRPLVQKQLPGQTAFSLDIVASKQGVVTAGGMEHHTVTATAGAPVTVNGWAVDAPGGALAAAMIARVDAYDVPVRYGIDRYDVGRALNNAQYEHSGFAFVVPAKLMTAGRHPVSLLIYAHDSSGYWLVPDVLDLDVK